MCSKIKISPYLVLLGGLTLTAPSSPCDAMEPAQQPRRSLRSTAIKTSQNLQKIELVEQKIDKIIEADINESKKFHQEFGSGKKRPQQRILEKKHPAKKLHLQDENDEKNAIEILASLSQVEESYVQQNIEKQFLFGVVLLRNHDAPNSRPQIYNIKFNSKTDGFSFVD